LPLEELEWEGAYRELLPRVFRYFWYRVGDRQIAEDLSSATFERAWRGRLRYQRDLGAFSTWLFGIARKVAADHFRHDHKVLPLEKDTILGAGDPPEEQVQRQGEIDRLAALLGSLGARDREILALKYGASVSNREIARQTGLSESNVGTILHRVVGRLRRGWEENE
jgi:RNA polymerase sigma-70 factor (ECF subfamily)